MTDAIDARLTGIEQALARLGRDVLLGALQPGLGPAQVRAALAAVDLPSDPDLEALYGWHDGTAADAVELDDIQMFPGYYLLPLDEAVDNYRTFRDDPRWRAGWLPVFADGGGDFYVLDLGRGADDVPVRMFYVDESDHPVQFASLGALVATIAAGFERGVFVVEGGYLEMDDEVFNDLAARLNPDVRYWTEPLD